MLLNTIIFILSLFLTLNQIINFIPAAVLCVIVIMISIFTKKPILIIFLIAGLLSGYFSGIGIHNSSKDLPDKGFAHSFLIISDFPELREDGQYQVHSGNIKIISTNAYTTYKTQTVEVFGYISSFQFGNQLYYNIYAKNIIQVKEGLFFLKLISNLRKWVNDKIETTVNPDIKSLLYCMILANTNFVDFSTAQTFKMTGVVHLLAISGLNVAIIAIGILFILKKFMKNHPAYLITTVIIILYIALAGFGASIMRAGLMFIIYNIFKLSGRDTDFFDIILASFIIVLTYNPLFIINPGFWLSYTAVIGIYFFIEIIKKCFLFSGKFISEMISVTLSANISTMPVLLYCFKGVSIISPIANLIIVPAFNLLTYLLFVEFIFLITGFTILNPALEFIIMILWRFSQKSAEILSFVPMAYQTVKTFTLTDLAAAYILIAGVFFILPKIRYYFTLKFLDNQ